MTRLGRVLRRTKLDELPQLWNVVRGEMALVGPRPEDPRYVDLADPLHARVFGALPGITGPTALAYRDEETIARGSGAGDRARATGATNRPTRTSTAPIARSSCRPSWRWTPSTLRRGRLDGDLAILGRTIGQVLRRTGRPLDWPPCPRLGGVRGRHLFVVDLVVIALVDRRRDGAALRLAALRRGGADLLPGGAVPAARPAADQRRSAASTRGPGRTRASASWRGSSSSSSSARSSGSSSSTASSSRSACRARTRRSASFPRSFFVLEGLLTLAGMGGVRFLDPRLDRVEGLATGRSGSARRRGSTRRRRARPDARLRRRRRRGDRHPHDRVGHGRPRACAWSGSSTTTARKRNQILRGQKVLGGARRARARSPG